MDSVLQDWFSAQGIVHEAVSPYTPEQNGRAEIANRHLNDRVRAMLFHYNLSKAFWADAIVYAAHLCNVKVIRRLGMTPYQAFHGTVPDVSSLRTFGCKVYAHVPDKLRRKLDAKSQLGVYLGPVQGGSCHVLVQLPGNKVQYRVCRFKDVFTIEEVSACADMQIQSESRDGQLDYESRGELESVPQSPVLPTRPEAPRVGEVPKVLRECSKRGGVPQALQQWGTEPGSCPMPAQMLLHTVVLLQQGGVPR